MPKPQYYYSDEESSHDEYNDCEDCKNKHKDKTYEKKSKQCDCSRCERQYKHSCRHHRKSKKCHEKEPKRCHCKRCEEPERKKCEEPERKKCEEPERKKYEDQDIECKRDGQHILIIINR